MEDLRREVLQAIREGKTLEEAQATIKLEKYKDWGQYNRYLPLNVKGMYKRTRMNRRPNARPRRGTGN